MIHAAFVILLLVPSPVPNNWKHIREHYKKGRFLVVLKEGLATGICASHPATSIFGSPEAELMVKISESGADYSKQSWLSDECTMPEPVRAGEVLQIKEVFAFGGELKVHVVNVSPHAITRGVGAFEHESPERGHAEFRFRADSKDYADDVTLAEQWVKLFDTQDEAARFGNTASGVFVKQIKTGMTPQDVEQVLGPPTTRADLEGKTLYKYKDMTVEFHDGKVADVR